MSSQLDLEHDLSLHFEDAVSSLSMREVAIKGTSAS